MSTSMYLQRVECSQFYSTSISFNENLQKFNEINENETKRVSGM